MTIALAYSDDVSVTQQVGCFLVTADSDGGFYLLYFADHENDEDWNLLLETIPGFAKAQLVESKGMDMEDLHVMSEYYTAAPHRLRLIED